MPVMLTNEQLAEIEARANADAIRKEQLRIQALGAAISRRDWHAAETAYSAIRDAFDARPSDATFLLAHARALEAENERLTAACSKLNDEVMQTLGRALGYPKFADDQETFPGATEADGICSGDMVAEAMAEQAARRIRAVEAERDALRAECERLRGAQGAAREAFLSLVADAEQFDEDYDGDVDGDGRAIMTLDYSLVRFPADPLTDLCAALGIGQNRNETLKDAIERAIAEPVGAQP